MTLKQYATVRIVIAMALAAFVASSVVRREFFWPVVAIAVAILVLLLLRRRVKEVLTDERDEALGGRAARWSIQIFSVTAVVLMFAFYAWQDANPVFEVIAQVLAYATCALMLLYSAVFTFLRRTSLPQ